MEAREEGTTSLSKTSVEKVVMAALRDGLLARACWPESTVDIALWLPRTRKEVYGPSPVLISPFDLLEHQAGLAATQLLRLRLGSEHVTTGERGMKM